MAKSSSNEANLRIAINTILKILEDSKEKIPAPIHDALLRNANTAWYAYELVHLELTTLSEDYERSEKFLSMAEKALKRSQETTDDLLDKLAKSKEEIAKYKEIITIQN